MNKERNWLNIINVRKKNALAFTPGAFTGSNYLFSSLSKESIDKEQKRHDKGIEDLQRAQIEWAKKRQERLDYINSEIAKEHKAEKRFMDLNSAMQQYFIVTGRQLEPLPPKPVLSDFYVPSEDHHIRELALITLSMVGMGVFCGIPISK